MFGMNQLLSAAGLDLERTLLVRHQDNRTQARGRTPYDLWRAGDGRLELYQRIQKEGKFKGGRWLVSFVVTPLNETLFIGVYEIMGQSHAAPGTTDPSTAGNVAGRLLYDTRPDDALKEYAGRIVVDWGLGFRKWVQRAHRQDKPIIELRRTAIEPPFPGFAQFTWQIRELASVPASWRATLSAVSGIYLLVCRSTGRKYIGSAYGDGGFWARWEDYLRDGHGGNEGMKLVKTSDYQVSILEMAASSSTPTDIINMEARWKDKLLTRQFGLNRN